MPKGKFVGNEGTIALRGVVRDGKLVGIIDHEENERGIALVDINKVTGRLRKTAGGKIIDNAVDRAWGSYMPGLAFCANNASLAANTVRTAMCLPVHFDAVRIPVLNYNTAAAETFDAHAVSVVGTLTDPVNGAGTWIPVLFSGSASVSVPAATSVSGRIYPGIVLSDPVYIASIPRTDGGTLPILVVSQYKLSANVPLWTFGTGGSAGGWADDSNGLNIRSFKKAGDFTSINQGGMTTANAAPERGYTTCPGVFIRARGKKTNWGLCLGDSITKASNANAYGLGWPAKIIKTLANDVAFVTTNAGVAASTTSEFAANAAALIPLLKPTHVIVPAFSPNNGSTTTVTDADIAQERQDLVKILDLCEANGAQAIVWTGCPRSTGANTTPFYSAADDARRVAWVLEAAASYNAIAVDTLPVLSTGSAPYAFAAGQTVEGLHPSSSGDTGIANLMLDVVNTL